MRNGLQLYAVQWSASMGTQKTSCRSCYPICQCARVRIWRVTSRTFQRLRCPCRCHGLFFNEKYQQKAVKDTAILPREIAPLKYLRNSSRKRANKLAYIKPLSLVCTTMQQYCTVMKINGLNIIYSFRRTKVQETARFDNVKHINNSDCLWSVLRVTS